MSFGSLTAEQGCVHITKSQQWYRAYGLEHWTFDEEGLMKERRASINDVPILSSERWFAKGSNERGADPTAHAKY